MNIFYVTNDPWYLAQALDNKRLEKQMNDACQLLSNMLHIYNIPNPPLKLKGSIHPHTKWITKSRKHYSWTCDLLNACIEEYFFRFKKQPECFNLFKIFRIAIPFILHNQDVRFMHPPNQTTFKNEKDIYTSYKKYLLQKWDTDKVTPVWFYRQIPCWRFDDDEDDTNREE